MSDYEELAGGIKSTGKKRTFETGAHRDSNTKIHKGRMDLVPAVAVRRFAMFCSDFVDVPKKMKVPEKMQPNFDEWNTRHVTYFYNIALQSMYLWLEGERNEVDGDDAYKIDHLSNALWHVQQIMHISEGEPIWFPMMPDGFIWSGERYDMISPMFLKRVSVHYQLGGINYGDRNWEKGMPIMVTWDSATRHLTDWLRKEPTEDHLAAFGWNVMSTMHTIEMVNRDILPKELNDIPATYRNIKRRKS
jgi:hypothetical protein